MQFMPFIRPSFLRLYVIMSEDLPLRARYPALNKHKGRSRAPALTLPAAGQQRLRSEKDSLGKKKEKEKSGEEAQGGECTESLNIKSGAPRHTSRH